MILSNEEIKELGKLFNLSRLEKIDVRINENKRGRPYLQQKFYKDRKESLENERRKLVNDSKLEELYQV